MNTEKFLSVVQKVLFVKFTLLVTLVLGLMLAKPVTDSVVAGAHKVCQFAMKSSVQCEKIC